jgi:hypothetical protein
MALSRRECLRSITFCAAALAVPACVVNRSSAPSNGPELFRTAGRGERGTIVVFMPDTSQTREVWVGLSDELRNDFELVAWRVTTSADVHVIADAIQRYSPVAIVLMNNPTVYAYREYQRQARVRGFPPALIVMSSFLEEIRRPIRNATGISYEVPLITAVTNMRRLSARSVDRIGVVLSQGLAGFVKRQADLASREQVVVQEEPLGTAPNISELKRAIRRVKERADALWILNDDRLLTPKLIADGWLPGLSERPRIPTIVGAPSLVSAVGEFGTFAVLPDHTALGTQAGELIRDIADAGWAISESVETVLPVSVVTTLDVAQARERMQLRDDAIKRVDRALGL